MLHRAEPPFVLIGGGKGDSGHGAAVKVIFTGDDLRLTFRNLLDIIGPAANGLYGSFHRFRSGVHGQDPLLARQLSHFFIKETESVVVKGAGGERHLIRLFFQRLDQFGVAVAVIEG